MRSENNELWWRDILTKCKKCNISQERLAIFAGISRRHLIRLKKNESVLSEMQKGAIESALEILSLSEPFTLMIDYVRIRFPTTDICHIFECILQIRMEHIAHEDFAHNGYDECYQFWDINVSVSQDIKLGCLLEMKGQGCRQFEGILTAQKRSWYDFFLLAINKNGKFKRLDLAINDKYGVLNIGNLTRHWESKQCVSKFGSHNYFRSGKTAHADEKDCMGETLYLGSRKSEIYFCIYEKDYEQYTKNNIPMEDAPIKNRFEIRLKNERAEIAVEDLLTYRDVEHTAFGIINQYIRFIDTAKSSYNNEVLEPKWAYFIGDSRDKIKLTTAPIEFSLERTIKWLSHQVAPSIKMIHELDNISGTKYMEHIYREAKLSDKHLKILEQIAHTAEDIITG